MRLSFFSSPLSARSLLLLGFAASLAVHLLRSSFSRWLFISFPSFHLRFFLLRVSIVFPFWCVRIVFCCSPSLAVMLFSFSSFPFVFIGLAFGVSSLAFFILAPCSLVLCFAFIFIFSANLCTVLSHSSCPFSVVFYSYGTFPDVFSGLCSIFSFPVCSLGLSLLSFILLCFCFSVLSVVYGASVLRLPSFPWGFSGTFRVPNLFFGISFIFLFVSPVLVFSPLPHAFIRYSGVRFSSWGCYFSCGSCCGSAFLCPFVSAPPFPHAAV